MKKTVCFLLPGFWDKQIGGFKMVFIYANFLARDGYRVKLVYPHTNGGAADFSQKARILLRYFQYRLFRKNRQTWFSLEKGVSEHFVWDLSEKNVPAADIYVATAIKTAEFLDRFRRIPRRDLYYYVQDFEDWFDVTAERVYQSYRLELKKIVTTDWLLEEVRKAGSDAKLIRYGMEHDVFYETVPFEQKDKFSITMLYHQMEKKGCRESFEAMAIVRRKYPQLKARLFGFYDHPDLPEYCSYDQSPPLETLRRLYNESGIFIGASRVEGFGLTIGEAMCCGAAVACTDNRGFLEMAKPEKTALVSPIQNAPALAENIIRLIEDDELRRRISEAGKLYMKNFSWQSSYAEYKRALNLGD